MHIYLGLSQTAGQDRGGGGGGGGGGDEAMNHYMESLEGLDLASTCS